MIGIPLIASHDQLTDDAIGNHLAASRVDRKPPIRGLDDQPVVQGRAAPQSGLADAAQKIFSYLLGRIVIPIGAHARELVNDAGEPFGFKISNVGDFGFHSSFSFLTFFLGGWHKRRLSQMTTGAMPSGR